MNNAEKLETLHAAMTGLTKVLSSPGIRKSGASPRLARAARSLVRLDAHFRARTAQADAKKEALERLADAVVKAAEPGIAALAAEVTEMMKKFQGPDADMAKIQRLLGEIERGPKPAPVHRPPANARAVERR